jgi:tryptophan synthase alpha chain
MRQKVNRIDKILRNRIVSGETIIAPFVPIGFPDLDTSLKIATAAIDAGADLIELGVPFSDPLAEGPTIQTTSYHALRNGVDVHACLKAAYELRCHSPHAPIILMGYYNPFLQYGLDQLAKDSANAGVDGLIVPDLPTEESKPLLNTVRDNGLHLIPILSPTSPQTRIEQACKDGGGFIYCVSLTGVTGARGSLHKSLPDLVNRIRKHTQLPILVGFGISKPEHVREVFKFADGSIFGSALIDSIMNIPRTQCVKKTIEFVSAMRATDS